jgi:hypothetical protein
LTLKIDYRSGDFPPTVSVSNGYQTLNTSWDELLWSALTVGRPNRQYIFQHGQASVHEALFRLSLVRMALERSGWGNHFKRTTAARTLDPTEKGAINYFLGLTVCKLFSAKLLDAPWMIHLDVFRPLLNPVLTGRSRPDLVGQTTTGGWIALECKGRLSKPDAKTMKRAKDQSLRLVSVDGIAPTLHIAGVMYFKNDVMQFHWRDPAPEGEVKRPIRVHWTDDVWRYYYQLPLALVQTDQALFAQMREEEVFIPIGPADVKISIRPAVLRNLAEGRWREARDVASEPTESEQVYRGDGIAVSAGPSWQERFADAEE